MQAAVTVRHEVLTLELLAARIIQPGDVSEQLRHSGTVS